VFYIYIMTNRWRSALYIGVTNNLSLRVSQHKNRVSEGFTRRYNVDRVVHFEEFTDIRLAIAREKQLKGGRARGKTT